MKNTFISAVAAITMLVWGNVQLTHAQDTIKKAVVKKPAVVKSSTTVVMPAGTKPAAVDPKTGKLPIPINPKTGRPYTKYGYGPYATNKYDATKATRKADSLQKAAAMKAAAKPAIVSSVVPPVTSPQTTDSAATSPTDKTLNGQYQYFLTKIYSYQRPLASALWKNAIDTMNVNKHKLADAQTKIADQDKIIADLKANANTSTETNGISLLGLSLSKGMYSLIMWTLVIAFCAIAVVVIVRSGSLKQEATYRTGLYSELEEEFKTYKSKANEKEKKLARELQTERNKVDELMGRG